MSWLFSRALVEAFSEENFWDGEPSAPLNGNPIPQAYCAPDKMTGFSRLSRFGMTFKPLTESRGEELLTLYLAGFPVKTLAQQGGGAGITGSRSGLWKEMARIIREVRPQYAFIENSPMLTLRGLDTVLCDLASMGFDANWGVVSAADVGAPHLRERIWILAHAMRGSGGTEPWEQQSQRAEIVDRGGERNVAHSIVTDAKSNGRFQGDANSSRSSQGMEPRTKQGFGNGCGFVAHSNSDSRSTGAINAEQVCKTDMAYTDSAQCQGNECAEREQPAHTDVSGGGWWSSEPNVGRVANGVASRVDRLKAIGNGQVPAVAAAAFQLLSEGL